MAKQQSRLHYLSLLGLLGLLGLITGNGSFYGFFGFFGFAGLSRIKQDERYAQNVARSGLNGFVVAIVGLALVMFVATLREQIDLAALGVAITFVAALLTFVGSFHYYDH